jgi:nucleoside-diphosphate-sugar epimerase
MRIFVTGGTGHVGRWLVRLLEQRGHEVMLLTRGAGGQAAPGMGGIRQIHGDLRDGPGVSAHIMAHKPEALVHLAWEGLPDYSLAGCLRNLDYGARVFLAAAEAGCSCVLATGSCWEYASRHGCLSEDDPLGAAGAFPAVKNALRFIGEAIARQYGRRFYWLRLFFVYGPGQRSTSLIPHVIEALRNNQPPKIQTPHNRHDFIFVEDVARAIAEVLERQPPGTVYNVGSGQPTAVEEIVRLIHRMLQKAYNPSRFMAAQPGAQQDFWADVSRLRQDTGWQPRYDVKSGLRASVSAIGEQVPSVASG